MLSGTGTIDLAEEFEKRIFFLDGVYNYNDNPKAKTLWGAGFGSPMDSLWANNNAQGSDSGLTTAAVTMATKSQILVKVKNGDKVKKGDLLIVSSVKCISKNLMDSFTTCGID